MRAQARAALLGPLKMFAAMKDETSLDKADGFNAFLAPLKGQLAALDKSDAELKAEETSLTGQLSDEQSRWNAFNSQMRSWSARRAKPCAESCFGVSLGGPDVKKSGGVPNGIRKYVERPVSFCTPC